MPAGQLKLVVKVASGPDPGYIGIVSVTHNDVTFDKTVDTASATFYPSTFGHATASGAIGVGAVPWWVASPWSSQFNPIPSETFSSFGPTLSIFSGDGTRHTPTILQKPDVSGPDGNDTSFFIPGFDLSTIAPPFNDPATTKELDGNALPNFFGTSSAAPNVAAVVALMKQLAPARPRRTSRMP